MSAVRRRSSASAAGSVRSVDIPVALEHADGIGRVVLDADREVAGFFVRPREFVS